MLRLINKKENFLMTTYHIDENEYYYSIHHDLFETKGIILANDSEEAAGMLLYQFRVPVEECECVSKRKFQKQLNETVEQISRKFLLENDYYQIVCN